MAYGTRPSPQESGAHPDGADVAEAPDAVPHPATGASSLPVANTRFRIFCLIAVCILVVLGAFYPLRPAPPETYKAPSPAEMHELSSKPVIAAGSVVDAAPRHIRNVPRLIADVPAVGALFVFFPAVFRMDGVTVGGLATGIGAWIGLRVADNIGRVADNFGRVADNFGRVADNFGRVADDIGVISRTFVGASVAFVVFGIYDRYDRVRAPQAVA